MSALSAEPESGWDEIVRIWEETDAPEGSKVEIIEGVVTVPPRFMIHIVPATVSTLAQTTATSVCVSTCAPPCTATPPRTVRR